MVSARPPNLPMSKYTQRTSSSSLFLEISTTSVSMTPALPTMPRPGSMMVSGIWLPKCLRSARKIDRPFGARAIVEDAAKHLGAGGGTGGLFDFRGAIDGKQANAEREGARDVTLLLDRIAKGNAIGGRAGGKRHLDFSHRGAIEARAHRGQQRQHFRRRVGLHRVEHAAVRQRLRECLIVVAHHFEVDDETRLDVLALVAAVAQEFLNTFGHSTLQTAQRRDAFKCDLG